MIAPDPALTPEMHAALNDLAEDRRIWLRMAEEAAMAQETWHQTAYRAYLAGWSQVQLAKALGLHPTRLNQICREQAKLAETVRE